MRGAILPLPQYVSMAWRLSKQRDFTFLPFIPYAHVLLKRYPFPSCIFYAFTLWLLLVVTDLKFFNLNAGGTQNQYAR
jgi:hypothetical protein